MKLELKNLTLFLLLGKDRWITSRQKEPNEIYNRIRNEEIQEDERMYMTDSFRASKTIPLIKETTKIPTLMMSKISMGHQTFLLDPPTKTWKNLLITWKNKKPEERMVIQIYTLSGRERAIIEVTDMSETCYPGKPIRLSLKLIVWL